MKKPLLITACLALVALGIGLITHKDIAVTAEATANATSTVIVPTSTVSITTSTPVDTAVDATVTDDVKPQTVYIYNTVRETIKEVSSSTSQPGAIQTNTTVGSTELIPAPVFTTPTVIIQPVQPVIVPIETTTQPEPVLSQPVAPEPEADHFTVFPTVRTETHVNGDWIFFNASWTGSLKGSVKCNGIYYYKNTVNSGFDAIVQKDQFNGNPGTDVFCEFWVGDLGGTQYSFTTEK